MAEGVEYESEHTPELLSSDRDLHELRKHV
jgi:hypothetical protein